MRELGSCFFGGFVSCPVFLGSISLLALFVIRGLRERFEGMSECTVLSVHALMHWMHLFFATEFVSLLFFEKST